MLRGKTERETCDLNGWGVGVRLIGDEGYGPTVIRITHFTIEGAMLALTESRNGITDDRHEHFWTLGSRDWTEAPPTTPRGPERK